MSMNEALIAQARQAVMNGSYAYSGGGDLIVALADALESLQSERDILAAGFKAAFSELGKDYGRVLQGFDGDPNVDAIRAALAVMEGKGERI